MTQIPSATPLPEPTPVTGTGFNVRKVYDPVIGIPVETTTLPTWTHVEDMLDEDYAWAQGLIEGGEIPARVTLNPDNPADPTRFFLVWHMHDGTVQTDTYLLDPIGGGPTRA